MNNKQVKQEENKGISRKDALKKMGFGAFTATTMMLVLNTPKAQADASGDEDGFGEPGSGDWQDTDWQ